MLIPIVCVMLYSNQRSRVEAWQKRSTSPGRPFHDIITVYMNVALKKKKKKFKIKKKNNNKNEKIAHSLNRTKINHVLLKIRTFFLDVSKTNIFMWAFFCSFLRVFGIWSCSLDLAAFKLFIAVFIPSYAGTFYLIDCRRPPFLGFLSLFSSLVCVSP